MAHVGSTGSHPRPCIGSTRSHCALMGSPRLTLDPLGPRDIWDPRGSQGTPGVPQCLLYSHGIPRAHKGSPRVRQHPLYSYGIQWIPVLHGIYSNFESHSAPPILTGEPLDPSLPYAHAGSIWLTWDPLGPPGSRGIWGGSHRIPRVPQCPQWIQWIPWCPLNSPVVPIFTGILCKPYRSAGSHESRRIPVLTQNALGSQGIHQVPAPHQLLKILQHGPGLRWEP